MRRSGCARVRCCFYLHRARWLSKIKLPSLLSKALVVYRVQATYTPNQGCKSAYNCLFSICLRCSFHTEPLPPPLLEHTLPSEAHFYPLTLARTLLLHTHSSTPFTLHTHKHGLNLTLYALPDCKVASLHLRVDWWASLRRAGTRYWTAVPGWVVGIVAWMLLSALGEYKRGGKLSFYRRFCLQNR